MTQILNEMVTGSAKVSMPSAEKFSPWITLESGFIVAVEPADTPEERKENRKKARAQAWQEVQEDLEEQLAETLKSLNSQLPQANAKK